MGLDTYLYKPKYIKADENYDRGISDGAYWRKCWGFNEWLKHNALEQINEYTWKFDTNIVKELLRKMQPKIDKMTKIANNLGYEIENAEDLRMVMHDIEDSYNEYYDVFRKILVTFNYKNLTIDVIEDSLWGLLVTFVIIYIELDKVKDADELELVESY